MKENGHTPQTENGYTRIANEVLEDLTRLTLPNYEFRVLIHIIRFTYGFHQKENRLSLSFIASGTGLLKQNAARALNGLTKKNIIIHRDTKCAYNKDSQTWKVSLQIPHNKVSQEIPIGIPGDTKKVSLQSTNKDNINKTNKDNIVKREKFPLEEINEDVLQEIASKYKVPLPFVKLQFEKMQNWIVGKNKSYSNYKRMLMNWVLKAIEEKLEGRRINDGKYRPVDATKI